jgi:hypothetical protein
MSFHRSLADLFFVVARWSKQRKRLAINACSWPPTGTPTGAGILPAREPVLAFDRGQV